MLDLVQYLFKTLDVHECTGYLCLPMCTIHAATLFSFRVSHHLRRFLSPANPSTLHLLIHAIIRPYNSVRICPRRRLCGRIVPVRMPRTWVNHSASPKRLQLLLLPLLWPPLKKTATYPTRFLRSARHGCLCALLGLLATSHVSTQVEVSFLQF